MSRKYRNSIPYLFILGTQVSNSKKIALASGCLHSQHAKIPVMDLRLLYKANQRLFLGFALFATSTYAETHVSTILQNIQSIILPNVPSPATLLPYTARAQATPSRLFAKPSQVNIDSLHWAAGDGDLVEVRRLLSSGVDPNKNDNWRGGTALHWAAHSGNATTIRALLEAGANIDQRDYSGATPLRSALIWSEGDILALTALLSSGADVEAKLGPSDPSSALGSACLSQHDDGWRQVVILRMFGANPNVIIEPVYGRTPLHQAVSSQSDERAHWIVQSLLVEIQETTVADVNAEDYHGATALHLAAWEDKYLVADALLVAGADVNSSAGDSGVTPLHIAAITGSTKVVLMLLRHNVSVNVRDGDGNTPLYYAESSGHNDIAVMLRSSGGIR